MHSSKHKHLPAREKSSKKLISISKRKFYKKNPPEQNSTSIVVLTEPSESPKEATGTFQSLTLNTKFQFTH